MKESYVCWANLDKTPYEMVYVTAKNRSEAEKLAWKKFKRLGISTESINCK